MQLIIRLGFGVLVFSHWSLANGLWGLGQFFLIFFVAEIPVEQLKSWVENLLQN